jgi:MFS family permease
VIFALLLLAVLTAARGVWSPCGLSMLSTITPIAERAKGHRYRWSAGWFILGATVGGGVLGLLLGVLSMLGGQVDLSPRSRLVMAAAVALLAVAADARLGGLRLPERPRQVDASWVDTLRPWAYAGGYGFQLGTAVSTYVMSNAIYVVLIASVMLLGPLSAFAVGAAFGVFRGLTILVGAGVRSPKDLSRVHAALDRLAAPSLAMAMVGQLSFVVVCTVSLDNSLATILGVGAAIALGACCRWRTRAPRRAVVGAA